MRSRLLRILRNPTFLLYAERLGVTLLFIAGCAVSFVYVNIKNAEFAARGGRFAVLETWLDGYIPFVPMSIFAYYLYYVWVLWMVPVVRERDRFYHAIAAFTVLQVAALITFVQFPSFMVRPNPVGEGLAIRLVQLMYKADQGFNLLPSLHVGHAVLVTLFYYTYKRELFPLILAGTVLIAVSTVLVKQHYVIDIPFGLLYAAAAFYATAPVGQWFAARLPASER